jgi:SAM-dependent methyltransferase
MANQSSCQNEWESFAEEWIQKMRDGDPHRVGLLDEWMLDAIGIVGGLRIIDLGCGEGRFCRMLAERGAAVTGVDFVPAFIEYASAHNVGDETYLVGDIQDLNQVPDESFDLAVSYVSLVDVPDLTRAVGEAYRIVRSGGRFIVCNLQPMSTAGNCWIKDESGRKLHFRLDNYFDESARAMGSITDYHRTLSTYINTFLEIGFRLEGIREPKPSPNQLERYPEIDDLLRVPHFIIYLLRKDAS